jgi:hypothetical protein
VLWNEYEGRKFEVKFADILWAQHQALIQSTLTSLSTNNGTSNQTPPMYMAQVRHVEWLSKTDTWLEGDTIIGLLQRNNSVVCEWVLESVNSSATSVVWNRE